MIKHTVYTSAAIYLCLYVVNPLRIYIVTVGVVLAEMRQESIGCTCQGVEFDAQLVECTKMAVVGITCDE